MSYNPAIRKSETDNNKIIIENFVGTGDIEAIIYGNTIYIPEKTYRHLYYFSSHGPYYYDEVMSGDGVLDISNYFLQINYTTKVMRENVPDNISKGGIAIYNYSKFSYVGIFTGDSATVIISSINDSL